MLLRIVHRQDAGQPYSDKLIKVVLQKAILLLKVLFQPWNCRLRASRGCNRVCALKVHETVRKGAGFTLLCREPQCLRKVAATAQQEVTLLDMD